MDRLTAALLFTALLFTPWAFGTTEEWSIWFMNELGYAVGLVLVGKWLIRLKTGWCPVRWNDVTATQSPRLALWVIRSLAGLTLLLFAYFVISALNARASYWSSIAEFEYYPCLGWLPHSYNRPATWGYLCGYVALAMFFWGLRDYLLIKTPEDLADSASKYRLPHRLRLLLWVLCLNGGLLALESMLQRATTNKLLWIAEPLINKSSPGQLGPYAYRSNGAQFLNLIWPVAVGFWWVLRRRAARHRSEPDKTHHVLLGCALAMVLAVLFSLSRGAIITEVFCLLLLVPALLVSTRRKGGQLKWYLAILLPIIPLLLEGPSAARFLTAADDLNQQRVEVWKLAWNLVGDNPWYGTGLGTFSAVFQLAPGLQPKQWYGQLHNDWLELLITLGGVGCGLLLLMLLLSMSRWFFGAGVPAHRVLHLSFCIALAGCLLHALADFPLQIYSILFLFVLHCSVLASISSRAPRL